MVVGENTLGKKMTVISQQAELSTTYTNRSIRATIITVLDRSGFEARHIMSVSCHRNESSIKSCSKTDENAKTNTAAWIAYNFPRGIYFERLERSNSQPPQLKHKAV